MLRMAELIEVKHNNTGSLNRFVTKCVNYCLNERPITPSTLADVESELFFELLNIPDDPEIGVMAEEIILQWTDQEDLTVHDVPKNRLHCLHWLGLVTVPNQVNLLIVIVGHNYSFDKIIGQEADF
jgi:hypothetical protein